MRIRREGLTGFWLQRALNLQVRNNAVTKHQQWVPILTSMRDNRSCCPHPPMKETIGERSCVNRQVPSDNHKDAIFRCRLYRRETILKAVLRLTWGVALMVAPPAQGMLF